MVCVHVCVIDFSHAFAKEGFDKFVDLNVTSTSAENFQRGTLMMKLSTVAFSHVCVCACSTHALQSCKYVMETSL